MKKHICVYLAAMVLLLAGCSAPVAELESTRTTTTAATEAVLSELAVTETTETETTEAETTAATETTLPEPADDAMVRVRDYIPDIVVELRYATEDNFTGQKIYNFTDAWLRYGTVKKLMKVQAELREKGLCLKIWDAFRPTAAQFRLWEICPDPVYVSNPNNGFSSHSRGNTVDVTLVYADGAELTMPTGFDDFSALADRDYSDCGQEAADNARFLEELMEACGFRPYFGEWWHFSDETAYEVETEFLPGE